MTLERILTDHGEPLQYLLYFGLLSGLAMMEAFVPRDDRPAGRGRASGDGSERRGGTRMKG